MAAEAGGDLVWRVHPARRQPGRAAAAGAFGLLVAGAVALGTGSAWLGLLAAGVVLASAAEFLLPATYRLTAAGAERRGLGGSRRVAWEAVRAAYLLPDGVKLSTLDQPGWLEPWRGLFVPWGERRDEVLARVDRCATQRRRPGEPAGEPGGRGGADGGSGDG